MKKYFYLIIFLALISTISDAQIIPGACGSWINHSENFEIQDSIHIQFDTLNANNQWMIGKPQKLILDSALSPINVLITDTINPCFTNDTSYAVLKIKTVSDYAETYLKFRHKYDIDSIHQKAYLECSYDNGITWRFMKDTSCFNTGDADSRMWQESDSADLNMNIGPDFKGTVNTWQTSGYLWTWIILVTRMESERQIFVPDTLFVRFVFINDSVAVTNDGWMIDDLEVYNLYQCGGINEISTEQIKLFPNPVEDNLSVSSPSKILEWKFFNLTGKEIERKQVNNFNDEIDMNNFCPGIYFLEVKTIKGIDRRKVLKQ